jgi:hypothetical protein
MAAMTTRQWIGGIGFACVAFVIAAPVGFLWGHWWPLPVATVLGGALGAWLAEADRL